MATSAQVRPAYEMTRSARLKNTFGNSFRHASPKIMMTLLGLVLLIIFLMPIGYMLDTAFKQDSQMTAQNAPLWPAQPVTFHYTGPELTGQGYDVASGTDLPLYNVPTPNGTHQWALVKGFRDDSFFFDPAHPENGAFDWQGRYRTLAPVYQFALTLENFGAAAQFINFPLLFRNTIAIAVLSTIGTLISSILVAYGFARFPIPGKNILFVILIATIILPPQTSLIPLFILYT